MNVADEILRAAEKLLAAKTRAERATEEYETAQAEYRKTVDRFTLGINAHNNGASATQQVIMPTGTLRDRIEQYMMQNPGVPLPLDNIERAVGAETNHKRLIWTLANMRRDGVIKHEGRGLWSVEAPEEPKEDDDLKL
jgi:hypothetical protein